MARPASARLGNWLPLHLALTGAVTVAISGNMMSFAAALTATWGPAPAVVWPQFVLVGCRTRCADGLFDGQSQPVAF